MGLWTGESSPLSDIQQGIISQRYQIIAMMSMIAGTVLSSIFMVLEGYKGWGNMGTEVAELMLIALGLNTE